MRWLYSLILILLLVTAGEVFGDENGNLARQLLSPETRLAAYHQLLTNAGQTVPPHDGKSIPKLVTCLQEKNGDPIFAVLTGDQVSNDSGTPKTGLLHPPSEPQPGMPLPTESTIDFFTSGGKWITPFGPDRKFRGILEDLNGDGFVELASVTRHPVNRFKIVDVLQVWTVRETPEKLLSVLINWDRDEWLARVKDTTGDGIPEIEIGPRRKEGISPEVAYQWDPATRTYTGPEGQDGDHFRKLPLDNLEGTLDKFQGLQLSFPATFVPRMPPRKPTPLEIP